MTYTFEGKNEKEAIENAANQLGLQRDQFDVEILESQKNSLFKKGYVKICVHTLDDKEEKVYGNFEESTKFSGTTNHIPSNEFEQKIVDFIKNVIERMGYEVNVDVVAHRCGNYGCALGGSLIGNQTSSDVVVAGIEVAHRLVEQDEVEWLAKCADDSHTLLLPYRQTPHWSVDAVVDFQCFKHSGNLFRGLEACEPVFQLHVFAGGELGK